MGIFFKIILLSCLFFKISWVVGAESIKDQVCHKKECINVEIADTPQERARGLMFREKLNQDQGMLFVFEGEQDTYFWMKNMYIPLDMVWINWDKEIVDMKENISPCTQEKCEVIMSSKQAKYVLEVNAGKIKNIGLKLGDSLDF